MNTKDITTNVACFIIFDYSKLETI
jgi:hypothetical protein